jgi:ABC-type enterobactin transport system permease subunit
MSNRVVGFRFVRFVVAVSLALTLLATAPHAAEARDAAPVAAHRVEQNEDTMLVCIALVGGAMLLAGGVWLDQIRRISS